MVAEHVPDLAGIGLVEDRDDLPLRESKQCLTVRIVPGLFQKYPDMTDHPDFVMECRMMGADAPIPPQARSAVVPRRGPEEGRARIFPDSVTVNDPRLLRPLT